MNITTSQTVGFIIKTLRPFLWPIMVMFFLALVWTIDISLRPYLLKIILNRISELPAENIFQRVAIPAALYILTLSLLLFAYIIYDYFINIRMFPHLRKKIIHTSFDMLLKKSHDY